MSRRDPRILQTVTSTLVLLASVTSLLNNSVYEKVITPEILAATLAQDMVALLLAICVLLLSRNPVPKNQVIILGVHGFYFYAYGIYVIERLYNPLYLVYMAVFSLSLFTSIVTILSLWENRSTVYLPKRLRYLSAGYMLLNAVIFNILWISQLLPLMQIGTKIEFFYSIYIIDLCFIMPMLTLASYLCIKNNDFGLLVTPSLLILGFTILFPLVLAEFMNHYFYNIPLNLESLGLFGLISTFFLILSVLNLRRLQIGGIEKSIT